MDNKKNQNEKYVRLGFKNRQEYLDSLSEERDLGPGVVEALSDVLGESEDFDGLLSSLDEAEAWGL